MNSETHIYITDLSAERLEFMLLYCNDNKLDLISHNVVDVSDLSGPWDTISDFVFNNGVDALMFKLRFK